jgi:hypothetical protein
MNSEHGHAREIELLGRDWLVNELRRAGVEVAYPENDKLIDLIAYRASSKSQRIVPIQLLAASKRKFGVYQKHSGIEDLLMVYIWNLQSPEEAEAYAMSYSEAHTIAQELGWTKTESWRRGNYFTSNPSEELLRLLEPFRMTPAKWQERIRGS